MNVSPGLVWSPNRPTTRYVPGTASREPAGQPGADRFRDQVTENDTAAAPGRNVTTSAPPPGEQSSLDQIRSEPLVIRISRAAWPTSAVHGNRPLVAMPMVSTGRRPAGYVCASALADSTRSAAWHGPSGGVVATLGEGGCNGVRLGVPVVEGVVVGVGLGDTLATGLPSTPHDRIARNSTRTTAPRVSSRRRQ